MKMARKLLCISLVMIFAIVLFAGCNKNESPASPASSPESSPAQSPPAQSPAPAPAAPPTAPAGAETPESAQPAGGWDFSNAKKVNLTYAIYLADVDPTTVDTCRYLDMVRDYTEGTVDYTCYANQTLCNGAEELDAVSSGLADIAFFPVAYGSGQLPVSYMLEYPGYAFNSDMAASYAFNDWFKQLNLQELSDYKLLYAIGQGNGCFMTTFDVNNFSDFRGKQIRCGAALTTVMEAYGINPTVMVFSEVYEALRTGVVQGFYGMLHAGNSAKLYEVTNCVTKDPYYIGSYIMIMNKNVWNSLTSDQQAAIEAATADAYDEFLAAGRAADAAIAVDVFKENNLKIVELSDADLAVMGAANAPIQEEYANSVPGGPEALALYRELAAKYNALYS